jgi:hypothetical protein
VAAFALGWLAITLWSAHVAISDAPQTGALALTQAALALPDVIAASLLAGGAAGLAVVELLAGRFSAVRRTWVRYGTGAASGLAIGALAAVLVVIAYGTGNSILVLALAVAVAAMLGGALAGPSPSAVVGAGFAGTLAWFGVGVLQGLFHGRLVRVFGGSSAASEFAASTRLSFAVSLIGGLIAGLVAYLYLRRRYSGRRYQVYVMAGAAPGLLILLADLITLVGGAQLLGLAGSVSDSDHAALRYLQDSRINHALLLLFAGALTAVLAYGRTLKPSQRS